jgi:hypothetical protein
MFKTDPELKEMMSFFSNESAFMETFNLGYQAYERGDWKEAKEHFD